MTEVILFEAKKFLVNYLKDKKINYEQKHPWREPWEFIVLHSFRVEAYTAKLLKLEPHSLSKEEIILTRLGAILHDVGRIQQREDHALIGMNIVEEAINSGNLFKFSNIDKSRLLYLIGTHSNKDEKDSDFCSVILKDADILDEIGVMSIFMASNWIDRGNPYFFSLLNQRVADREIKFCDESYCYLITESAKTILKQKREFIQNFNKQLSEEIEETEEFGEIALEDYFA